MVDSKGLELFKVDGVSKIYGKSYIINNVTFSIKAGEILGIIGRSGSGKTTFLNTLVGFVKPDKGDILFRDLHLLGRDDEKSYRSVYTHQKQIKRMYGFASQNPSFYPNLTAWENLMYFGSLYNIPKESLVLNAENLLELVGLNQARNMVSRRMSGGMQRRLDIACSLIHDPKILILDEPTADLDPVLSNKIWNILRVINQKGTTIIIASHHLVELENLCDRIVIFKEGKIASIGNPQEIKSKNLVEETIYLRSSPGRYTKVMTHLSKTAMKDIVRHKVEDKYLIIDVTQSAQVIKNLINVLEDLKENVIDIEFKKPTLDKVFIRIDDDGREHRKKKNKLGSKDSKEIKEEKKEKSDKKEEMEEKSGDIVKEKKSKQQASKKKEKKEKKSLFKRFKKKEKTKVKDSKEKREEKDVEELKKEKNELKKEKKTPKKIIVPNTNHKNNSILENIQKNIEESKRKGFGKKEKKEMEDSAYDIMGRK